MYLNNFSFWCTVFYLIYSSWLSISVFLVIDSLQVGSLIVGLKQVSENVALSQANCADRSPD